MSFTAVSWNLAHGKKVERLGGRTKKRPGNPRRFDSIWSSDDFEVQRVTHYYEGAFTAGTDHALVTAELRWRNDEAQ